MEIDVNKINNCVENFKSVIKSYDDNVLELQNKNTRASSCWLDNNATLFFENVERENRYVNKIVDNLKQISAVYAFVIHSYSHYGDKIKINLNSLSSVENKMNNLIDGLNQLIYKYNNLDLKFGPSEYTMILNQKNKIINIKKDIIDLKKMVINDYNKIEKTESEISKKINKINIQPIKENDISNYISGGDL